MMKYFVIIILKKSFTKQKNSVASYGRLLIAKQKWPINVIKILVNQLKKILLIVFEMVAINFLTVVGHVGGHRVK